jgi:Protein of unknown function (DUF3574)
MSNLSASRLLCGAAVVWVLQGCAAPSPATTPRCASQTHSRLYFGLDSPHGPLSEAAWQAFVDSDITPRLPEGFTWLAAKGQWRGDDGLIRREDSRVLDVVGEDSLSHRQALAEIAGRYKQRFAQQSVLRRNRRRGPAGSRGRRRVLYRPAGQAALTTRSVEAGCWASFAAVRRGRRTNSPPQFGQMPLRRCSTQSAQNVHS